MTDYYTERLSASRLRRCYALATPAVRRYLATENEYVRARTGPADRALELGCGYGRVMREIAPAAGSVVGIDTSIESLDEARRELAGSRGAALAAMNALRLGFSDGSFDLVFCVQNGISAFHVDRAELLRSALRVTREGGRVLFSSYADEFWNDRLEWFRLQADAGLIGEIDEQATGGGTIVCRDGFVATTVSPAGFERLTESVGAHATIEVVEGSSVFCEIRV